MPPKAAACLPVIRAELGAEGHGGGRVPNVQYGGAVVDSRGRDPRSPQYTWSPHDHLHTHTHTHSKSIT